MNLFDDDTLLSASKAADPIDDGGFFFDLREWHRLHPRENIPPDPSVYSKEALQRLPDLEWLNACDIQLLYPRYPEPARQREELKEFMSTLLAEAVKLPQAFCSRFPNGYNEPLIALDTETTGLDTRLRYNYDNKVTSRNKIVGVSLAISDTKGWYLPIRHTQEDGVPNWDHDVMMDFVGEIHMTFAVIYHNSFFDRETLALNGCKKFRPFPYFFDTMILDYIYNVNNKVHGLKMTAKRLLGRAMIEIHELFHGMGAKKSKEFIYFDTLPATTGTVYATADTLNTYGLFKFYAAQPQDTNMFNIQPVPVEIDHRLVEVLRNMCRLGIPINLRYFFYAAKDALYRAERLEQYIYGLVGRKFEINSPKQLSDLLFKELRIPPCDEKGEPVEPNKQGNYSTKEEILDKLFEKYPDVLILTAIVRYRKIRSTIAKIYFNALVNSYADASLPYMRVQPSFSQTNVPTGRLSSSSSDGAERLTLKISGKNNKKSYSYFNGSWDCGFNTQGVPSQFFKHAKAKKIKKLPDAAGIDLKKLYPDWVEQAFQQGLAEV